MNPVFIAIILIVAFLVWLMLSSLFYPFGNIIHNIVKNIKKTFKRK